MIESVVPLVSRHAVPIGQFKALLFILLSYSFHFTPTLQPYSLPHLRGNQSIVLNVYLSYFLFVLKKCLVLYVYNFYF